MKNVSLKFALIATLALTVASAQTAPTPAGDRLGGGFNGPQGVLVGPDGVYVIDSGVGGDATINVRSPEGTVGPAKFGESARVVRVAPDGTQTVIATLPSLLGGMEAVGGARLAWLGNTLYATSGDWSEANEGSRPAKMSAVVRLEGGSATEVANTWDLEATRNPDGYEKYSHPYAMAAGPDGKLWVADAGANNLLRVDPASGVVELVAVMPAQPSAQANPGRGGKSESDAVPTGLAFGDDGSAYVALLPGSFMPEAAKVYRVSGAGEVSEYAGGLSTVTDLRRGPDGNLYATQLGQFGEQGPVPGSGSVVRVVPGGKPEVVISGLTLPSSLDFNADGDVYVVTGALGAPGSGELMVFKGVAAKK
ncbi:sugar lactone lactonase YvrE [Deinobacterium chartae]|uniref:Sugar lactone lactonase YvrE n=1 Tax=Deinobacterium chartae TaxID=521158 RepID=A0A841I5A4_9DEIO|nr:ScyD/ScyE family protein [Deinobacterium chartae]MBB6099620.1 sugar lactone lactonase YvrE [Deinobacterium chartae]